MKHLAKKIFKESGITEYEIPDYKAIEDHKEAKETMKTYLEQVMEENESEAV